ncbi:hypothetical protein PTSG_09096 [Salpingoeca rosetta]|uniref:Exostosin GT47 domain-containing protein n=1 Tax=Salpingoeca rosetta (strain ATCC 50818 / BSB-021) TaxID=946362 RepID=F2UMQ2_SALR5|nr:uncharacterized protein PTSG_09096 [Salpingoeca rosetta]EGD78401.1 hypothetical protein PTSG_09096 [Salpingoeca rosetta]|eukprot:XP_004989350.1 hypothetical protein PTSG_09096 [Salpingoeca rosetta]
MNCYTADASGAAAWLWTMTFSCHGIPCNSPSILIVDPAASAVDATILEFHHRGGLHVSMSLFFMVTFIHTGAATRSARTNRKYLVTFRWALPRLLVLDAMCNHLPKLHNGRDIVLVCACRWLGEERMGREGKRKSSNTELALETKFGLIIMAAGAIPVIVVDHYVPPYQDLLDWETFSICIPEHRLLELPRVLRSIPDEVVEMMRKRVVFVFEEFFYTGVCQDQPVQWRQRLAGGRCKWKGWRPTRPMTRHTM